MQDVGELSRFVVRIGGRPVHGGWDRLARYCGLPWSGGENETWAFRYYDSIPNPQSDAIRPADVLAAAALHPGITRSDLHYFYERRNEIADWLGDLPTERTFGGVDGSVLRHLSELASWDAPGGLPLLTKVLHRKRPLLIPLVDRHVLDWYRPIGDRARVRAGGPCGPVGPTRDPAVRWRARPAIRQLVRRRAARRCDAIVECRDGHQNRRWTRVCMRHPGSPPTAARTRSCRRSTSATRHGSTNTGCQTGSADLGLERVRI